jgi:hypothetical protein
MLKKIFRNKFFNSNPYPKLQERLDFEEKSKDTAPYTQVYAHPNQRQSVSL